MVSRSPRVAQIVIDEITGLYWMNATNPEKGMFPFHYVVRVISDGFDG